MKTTHASPPSSTPSGFSILINSRLVQALGRLWIRLNNRAQPLLPLIHLFMLIVLGGILCTVFFANQHIPCWGDEICMLDPAYYRAITGVWHSAAQWDSFDSIPFAPHYPLFINYLRSMIVLFGANHAVLRSSMLILGWLPIVFLLVWCRGRGYLQSWREMLYSIYAVACFTFFRWTISVRPEPSLLLVSTLLFLAWNGKHIVPLFFSALLVPLCGLHWNMLLLPVAIHWLVFGGSMRKHFTVALAFSLSTALTFAGYWLFGMWPSYMQEIGRTGDMDLLGGVVSKLHGTFAAWDFGWILSPSVHVPHLVIPVLLLVLLSAMAGRKDHVSHATQKVFCWLVLSMTSVVMALSLHYMSMRYLPLIFLPAWLLSPLFLRPWLARFPLAVALLAFLPLKISLVNWSKVADSYAPRIDGLTEARWLDEAALERALDTELSPDDMPLATDSAWFAVRSRCHDMMPLCYAFDISEEQQRSITAVLLADEPSSILHKDGSGFRHTSYAKAMLARFCPPEAPCPDPDAVRVSPEDLLSAIADCWHCSFTEVPIPPPTLPNAIRYRLFRPVFPEDGTGKEQVRNPPATLPLPLG